MSHRSPRDGWRRVTLADMGGAGSINEPGTALSGTPTQNSDGSVSFPLAGSHSTTVWSTIPDPDTMVHGIAPLYDAYGRQVTGDASFATSFRIRFPGGAPLKTDNVVVGCGIINEASPFGSTVDGYLAAFDANNGTVNGRRVRVWTLKDGTVGNHVAGTSDNGLTAGAGIEVGFAHLAKIGMFCTRSAWLIDSTNTGILTTNVAPASAPNVDTTGPKYIVWYVGRNDGADTDQYTVSPVLEYLPPVLGS